MPKMPPGRLNRSLDSPPACLRVTSAASSMRRAGSWGRHDVAKAERCARRSHRPKPAFRKVILDGDRRSDGRYLEISASSEECCICKAVNERGLNSGPVGLADAISEDEAATGTAFALM